MEIINIINSPLYPAFAPKAAIRKVPLISGAANALNSVYIERGGNKQARDELVQKLVNRTKLIENDQLEYAPLCIFAEGMTSNGTHLLPFKRGAFESMRTITPCFFQMTSGQISPTYEVIDFLPLLGLLLSSLYFRYAVTTIMPDFTPNAWMLENHADKGQEPWEIYAWCLRDAMAKHSGFKTLDEKLSLKDKLEFFALMGEEKDEATINGQIFKYKGGQPI